MGNYLGLSDVMPYLLSLQRVGTLLVAGLITSELWHDVCNIIPRVPVQALFEPLLVQIMANETYSAPKHKQPIEAPDFDVLVSLFGGEGSTVPQQVHKAGPDAAVYI